MFRNVVTNCTPLISGTQVVLHSPVGHILWIEHNVTGQPPQYALVNIFVYPKLTCPSSLLVNLFHHPTGHILNISVKWCGATTFNGFHKASWQ
jgi:hypothetical protein